MARMTYKTKSLLDQNIEEYHLIINEEFEKMDDRELLDAVVQRLGKYEDVCECPDQLAGMLLGFLMRR